MKTPILNGSRNGLDLIESYNAIYLAIEDDTTLGEIKERLSKPDFLIFRDLRKKGFTVREIKRIAEDQAKEIAILTLLNSRGKLKDKDIKDIGFKKIEEKSFPIDSKFKQLIRLDGYGYIDPSIINGNSGKLSTEYKSAIDIVNPAAKHRQINKELAQEVLDDTFAIYRAKQPGRAIEARNALSQSLDKTRVDVAQSLLNEIAAVQKNQSRSQINQSKQKIASLKKNTNPPIINEVLKQIEILRNPTLLPDKKETALTVLKICQNKIIHNQLAINNPNYTRKDYNLYNSEDWRTYYAIFPRFKRMERRLIKALIERRCPPETIKSMNFYDFQDLMLRAYRKPGKDRAILFDSPLHEDVKRIMRTPENVDILRRHMLIKGLDENEIREKIKEMSEEGILGRFYSKHHRQAVKNAGALTRYSDANNPDNTPIVSSEVHYIIHSLDRLNESTGIYTKIEVPPADLILSVTDLLRTPYTGPQPTKTVKNHAKRVPAIPNTPRSRDY